MWNYKFQQSLNLFAPLRENRFNKYKKWGPKKTFNVFFTDLFKQIDYEAKTNQAD